MICGDIDAFTPHKHGIVWSAILKLAMATSTNSTSAVELRRKIPMNTNSDSNVCVQIITILRIIIDGGTNNSDR